MQAVFVLLALAALRARRP
ncbi:MAG: hypothetical protein MUC96_05085 [Myxococcaceae bacterium]|nr:hypothetical protein [Myxococcaceae bacterium]